MLMGFKRGRKSIAQINREKKRAERKERENQLRFQSDIVSTAVRILEIGFIPPSKPDDLDLVQVREIGPFRFVILNPMIHHRGVKNKFSVESQYGCFAPYRDEIFFELFTKKEWWHGMEFDAVRFQDWDPEEQLKIVQGFSDVVLFLFRVRGFTFFSSPFDLNGSSFHGLQRARDGSVSLRTRMKESLMDAIPLPNPNPHFLSDADFEWINNAIIPAYTANQEGKFNFLFEIYESLHYPNPAVQLTQIWAGIEFLLKSSKSRVKRSIRARCAMILGDTQDKQKEIYADVGRLYDLRSSVVHGVEALTLNTVLEGLTVDEDTGLFEVNGTAGMLFKSFSLLNELVLVTLGRESTFFSKEELDGLETLFEDTHPELFNA